MIEPPPLFCCVCRDPVPPKRVAKGAVTCGNSHAILKKKRMRDYRAGKHCSNCGRPARKPRVQPAVSVVPALDIASPAPGAGANTPAMVGLADSLEVVHGD